MKLTFDILCQEYDNWLQNYGKGRDENDLRFGQYIHNEYELNQLTVFSDLAFYAENPTTAFEHLSEHLEIDTI